MSWTESMRSIVESKDTEIKHLRNACAMKSFEIEQTLGKALGYSESDGVFDTGMHMAETLAIEAAEKIKHLQTDLHNEQKITKVLEELINSRQWWSDIGRYVITETSLEKATQKLAEVEDQ